ncbi:3632_t:CDS:2, partial [Dentiscutata heterogama]
SLKNGTGSSFLAALSDVPETSRSKTETIIGQISSTQEVLRSTLVDIANRDEKLDTLKQKSDSLKDAGLKFSEIATKTSKKLAKKNTKMTIILTVVAILIVAAIVDSVTIDNGSQ